MKEVLLKNARLIDGSIRNILIKNNKIISIDNSEVKEDHERKIVDIEGKFYVSAGWIDLHTHCFNKFKLYSDEPDTIGYKTGVTTVIDAGTSGADDIDEFYKKAKECKTNVFSLINVSKIGIKVQSELSNIEDIDYSSLREKIEVHKDFIIGFKARMSNSVVGKNGIKPLIIAKKFSKEFNVPLMVHIGTEPPKLKEVLDILDNGDIVSHIFNGKSNGILDGDKKLKNEAIEAKERGVIFDIAHGKDSFNFEVAKTAFDNGIKADTISTDIYKRSREEGPVFDLSTTMDKALCIGYTLKEIIDMVTANPAKAIGLSNKGRLEIGSDGDITIFDICNEKKELLDSNGNKVVTDTVFKPKAVVINNEYIEI